jgi:glycosyltransferase involved in cell wall biosynthesis
MNTTKGVVWYISQYAAPIKYAFGSRHFSFAQEFQKQGYKTYVIASAYNKFFEAANKFPPNNNTYNTETIDGVETLWIKGISYVNNGGIKRILSWFLFTRRLFFIPKQSIAPPTTIIVSSLSLPPILAGIYFKHKYKCTLIFEIRDLWPLTLIDVVGVSKWHPLVLVLGAIEKLGYSKADAIVTTMPSANEYIKTRISKPFNYKCIPQGINLEVLNVHKELPNDFVKNYIPANKFIVGYAGSLSTANTINILIEAMQQLDANLFHACILGDGPNKNDFIRMANNAPNITFINGVEKQQVAQFLNYCSVMYMGVKHKKIYTYGLSLNKATDYMYAQKPILLSYTGFKNNVMDANCGTVIPAEDAIALANAIKEYGSKTNEELQAIGANGLNYLMEHCTFETLAQQYIQLF